MAKYAFVPSKTGSATSALFKASVQRVWGGNGEKRLSLLAGGVLTADGRAVIAVVGSTMTGASSSSC